MSDLRIMYYVVGGFTNISEGKNKASNNWQNRKPNTKAAFWVRGRGKTAHKNK